ncbi:MAG: hypothetical protein ACLS6F_08165, partial [Bifidobacterium breve]
AREHNNENASYTLNETGPIHLREIVDLVDGKCSHIGLSVDNYISTDNMLKKRGGICPSAYLPVEGRVTRFQQNDILLSNIRPYFKKIWLSDRIGGCCADVLVFRAKHREHTEWLYQTMAADRFFSICVYRSQRLKNASRRQRTYDAVSRSDATEGTTLRFFEALFTYAQSNCKAL